MKVTAKTQNEKFSKLIENYNNNQSNFPDIIKQYAPDIQEEKRQLHLQTGVNLYKPQFETLAGETGSLVKTNISEKNKLKYPLRFSDNSSERLLGEQKLTNARILFTQLKDSPALLASELQNLIDSNDSDSANDLIDIVILHFGSDPRQDLENFNRIKDVLNQNSGLNDIDNELKDLQNLEGQINDVVAALNDGTPYVILPFQAAALSDEDFFNLQNKLKDQFGDSALQKIRQLAS